MSGCSARIRCAARSPSSVCVGRHADVDDGDVGLVRADLAQEVLRVAGLAGDLEAGLLQQARETLAQEHGVLGDHDARWARSYGDLSTQDGTGARR